MITLYLIMWAITSTVIIMGLLSCSELDFMGFILGLGLGLLWPICATWAFCHLMFAYTQYRKDMRND